jgi:adenine deaminase
MLQRPLRISGNIVDIIQSEIYPGTLEVAQGKLVDIIPDDRSYDCFIIPGLIDAHVHIESSMMTPAEFARIAVTHGTVAAVSDPHEIANVMGIEGIRYMIASGRKALFKFYFGISPCVPATKFETSGARIDLSEIEALFQKDHLKYVSELMNYPGVLSNDPEVWAKIAVAHKYGKPIDGHAPGLTGKDLLKYVQAGISTDHEAFQLQEGLTKIKAGMKILIREGTAAKDFTALSGLLADYSDFCMFCCDDKHPNDLVQGHINDIVKRALLMGYDKFKVLKCASLNPVKHYGLDVGLLQKGDPADFVIIDDFENFRILQTYVAGKLVAENGRSRIAKSKAAIVNYFKVRPKKAADFEVKAQTGNISVIEAADGELITKKILREPQILDGMVVSDPEGDVLKITVVNRYQDAPPAVAFIKNFGLKKGAIASSVAHDSHNIIAIGVTDEDIAKAVNLIIKNKGGLTAACGKATKVLPLPIAGLMSGDDGYRVAQKYSELARYAKTVLGSTLKDPYMTMSFMALLVIPDIKISDKGLFDGRSFQLISLFEKK